MTVTTRLDSQPNTKTVHRKLATYFEKNKQQQHCHKQAKVQDFKSKFKLHVMIMQIIPVTQ